MAITYSEAKRIVQPLFERYRNIFRGPRSSHFENLEMNKILIDLKRLDEKIDKTNSDVYDKVRILVGQVDPEAPVIHDQKEDGLYYKFLDENIFFYSGGMQLNPILLEVPTTLTLSGRLSALHEKIKRLEDKGMN